MPNIKKASRPVVDGHKAIVCAVIDRAVWDYKHPRRDPQRSLDASIFLLFSGREWAEFCGMQADESKWEAIIGKL